MSGHLKVAFDIGGVISRYPDQMKDLMSALLRGGVEVFILTDMNQRDAMAACRENGLIRRVGNRAVPPDRDDIRESWIISADWSAHGDLCKSDMMDLHEIDILIDDRPDYAASGDFIGLVLSPRPDKPYYAPGWDNRSTHTVCVPPEEYEAFKAWKAQKPAPIKDTEKFVLPDSFFWECPFCRWTGIEKETARDEEGVPLCPNCLTAGEQVVVVRTPLSEMRPT